MTPPWKNKIAIMGIINITPDSFSGDGITNPNEAIALANKQLTEGADILDFGAESTRPGASTVNSTDEIKLLEPVLKSAQKLPGSALISVDTYKSETAEMALRHGACIINDIWGGEKDPTIRKIAAKNNSYYIITHNRSDQSEIVKDSKLGNSETKIKYNNFINDIISDLADLTDKALSAGIKREKIILDPGFGFGKSPELNLLLLKNLASIKVADLPLLSGTSRKSFIGLTLNLPPNERLAGSLAAASIAVMQGADILRVHDVKANRQCADFTKAVRDAAK